MSETDEEALEIENGAKDKYYDVTKVEHLAQETLKRNMGGSKGEASMGEHEQPSTRKRWRKPSGERRTNRGHAEKLFSTLGRKSKEEFVFVPD